MHSHGTWDAFHGTTETSPPRLSCRSIDGQPKLATDLPGAVLPGHVEQVFRHCLESAGDLHDRAIHWRPARLDSIIPSVFRFFSDGVTTTAHEVLPLHPSADWFCSPVVGSCSLRFT